MMSSGASDQLHQREEKTNDDRGVFFHTGKPYIEDEIHFIIRVKKTPSAYTQS
jgi:hypothetical protein